jgi:hypothetical protein
VCRGSPRRLLGDDDAHAVAAHDAPERAAGVERAGAGAAGDLGRATGIVLAPAIAFAYQSV